jgi:hypothetical protein
MLTLTLAAALAAAAPQGDRLAEGTWCYDITLSKGGTSQVIGQVFQSLERVSHDGKPALKVVVHQRMGAKFDMRDTFLLDAATLRPFELANTRFGKPHVRDVYVDGKLVETRWDEAGKETTVEKPLAKPAWEGNLFGLLFAALPLEAGDSYSIPYYQYDKGEGAFSVEVTGRREVDTPEGKREAIVLQAGPSASERIEYLVGADPRIELGYAAEKQGFAQALAPSCKAFDAAK